MPNPQPIDPDRIERENLSYLGGAGGAENCEEIPVYEHPDCEPYMDDVTYNLPGVRPDGTVVEFVYDLAGCFDPETGEYVWMA